MASYEIRYHSRYVMTVVVLGNQSKTQIEVTVVFQIAKLVNISPISLMKKGDI